MSRLSGGEKGSVLKQNLTDICTVVTTTISRRLQHPPQPSTQDKTVYNMYFIQKKIAPAFQVQNVSEENLDNRTNDSNRVNYFELGEQ